jgi:pyruvate carboxylase
MEDGVKIKGMIAVEKFDSSGNKVYEYKSHNLIVNAGLPTVAGLMGGIGGYTAFGYIGIGTVNGTPVVGDTQLNGGGEIMRVASTNSLVTTAVTNDTLQMVATFNFTASYTLYEAGVFNASAIGTGTMLAEASLGTVTVASGDSVQITWKIQV